MRTPWDGAHVPAKATFRAKLAETLGLILDHRHYFQHGRDHFAAKALVANANGNWRGAETKCAGE
ncbi:MAG TPA: hypothetical protein DDZ51_02080 [Planctomycetaceae bacterium]|nr:hypothetical protein [Planctomycetaceae bacterium]